MTCLPVLLYDSRLGSRSYGLRCLYFSQIEAVVGIFSNTGPLFGCLITGSSAREGGERTGNCNCYLYCLARQSVA